MLTNHVEDTTRKVVSSLEAAAEVVTTNSTKALEIQSEAVTSSNYRWTRPHVFFANIFFDIRKIEAESERIAFESINIVKTDLDRKTKELKEVGYLNKTAIYVSFPGVG